MTESGKTISVQRKYAISTTFLDTTLESEDVIREGETREDAMNRVIDDLDRIADNRRKKLYPHREEAIEVKQIGTIQVDNTPADGDEALALIKNAPSLEILGTFKLIAATNKELYEAYNKRLKELTK